MRLALLASTGNPGAIFGVVAILCWMILLCTIFALIVVTAKRNRRGIVALSAFLLGGVVGAALIWQTTRPQGLSFRESLRAGLTDEGLRTYGHPIEHNAEVAICFSTYACVLAGGLCAAAAVLTMKVRDRRRPI